MFTLLARDSSSAARRGRLVTAHGVIETPIFMPVGTQGAVKGAGMDDLRGLNAQIILGNTYHLFLRPGMEVIRHFGGLHAFNRWDRPILTDSGGYQVFSLAKLRRIKEEGVYFQSHLDGSKLFISPEVSMEIQATLGSDIAMAFDECPPYPCTEEYAAKSLALTLRWAARCREWIGAHAPAGQLHFGIVQGGTFAALREESAKALVAMDWAGYAVGGVSVGEPEPEMMRAAENSVPFLPEDRPRYCMGLGTPKQIVELVARGIDMFDCVLPTRLARHGSVYTDAGTLNLKNKQFEFDKGPLVEGCSCPCCREYSRAYVRHLLRAQEIAGLRLVTLHNLHYYLDLARRIREAIETGTFADFRARFVAGYRDKPGSRAAGGEGAAGA
ncbi:MAG: tRNA guanosine(34) transglycosylase Tgt [Verrucomicrobia bacterium]|nr:tRNA guanosine(34) transglycosylase Tgt [Verrucomicrobiota bacterium]